MTNNIWETNTGAFVNIDDIPIPVCFTNRHNDLAMACDECRDGWSGADIYFNVIPLALYRQALRNSIGSLCKFNYNNRLRPLGGVWYRIVRVHLCYTCLSKLDFNWEGMPNLPYNKEPHDYVGELLIQEGMHVVNQDAYNGNMW